MTLRIIKSRERCRDPFTNRPMVMKLVEVPNELTSVGKLHFYNNHRYNMKINGQDNKLYLYFNHPDYNDDVDYLKYRKLCGLMLPGQIRKLRHRYRLSTRELGAILGISHATISNIENNNQIQSPAQDTILRTLLNPRTMSKLIIAHLPLLKMKHLNQIQIDGLIRKSKALAKIK